MTIEELLNRIDQGIAAEKAKPTEEQDAALLAKLEGQKTALSTATLEPEAGDGDKSELDELRKYKQDSEDRALVERISGGVLDSLLKSKQTREERIAEQVKEVLGEHLGVTPDGGFDLDSAVTKALSGRRELSRFAGPGADLEAVKALADGGSTAATPEVRVGEDRAIKAIEEGANLAQFLGIASRIKNGMAEDVEMRFMKGVRQKAMAEGTDTAGGFLVPQEWMPDILGLLRANTVVRAAGPRLQPFNKQMNQTAISSGATAYYTQENARITPSEPTLAEAPLLTPKDLTGLVAVSNDLLNDSPSADTLVRADLAEVMGLREDLAFLQGTNAGGAEPLGLRNFVGRTQNPLGTLGGGNGELLTLAQMRRFRAKTRTLNAQNPTWVWFFAPEFITHLETLTDPDGRFLADSNILKINPDGLSGTFDGVPFFSTTTIPANLSFGSATNATYVILANIKEVVVGENQDLIIDVSNEATYTTDGGTTWRSAFQERQTLFRASMRHDIAPRRPNQVLVQEGVLVEA